MKFVLPEGNTYTDQAGASDAALVIRAFRRKGYQTEQLGKVCRISRGDDICFVHWSDTSFTSSLASKIWQNKGLSRRILRDQAISVPRGRSFGADSYQRGARYAQRLSGVVVKPADGARGIGVSVNVAPSDLASAWDAAKQVTVGRIMVEEYFPNAQEARYLVVDGTCVGVSFRFPAKVRGDGASPVKDLVDRQNVEKVARNPARVDSLLELDTHRINLLTANGLTPESVLPDGQELVMSAKANLSSGGSCYEYGTAVHRSFLQIAEKVANSVPGSHVLGVDILAFDHFDAAAAKNHVVLEANTMPGLDLHMFPDFGTPNDVAAIIADSCIEKMAARARYP